MFLINPRRKMSTTELRGTLDVSTNTRGMRDSGKSKLTRGYRVWCGEEENQLRQGVLKCGLGAWEVIRRDPEFPGLSDRSGVQLKDKWRNLVKFRHIGAEEQKTYKPKNSGPWSKKYSEASFGVTSVRPARVRPRVRSKGPSRRTGSSSTDTSLSGSSDDDDADDEHAAALLALEGGSLSDGGGRQQQRHSQRAAVQNRRSFADVESGRNDGEGGMELDRRGGGGDSDGDHENGSGHNGAYDQQAVGRKRQRLAEDRRFGIYDQRRYSAKRRAAAAAAGMPLGGSDDDMGVGGESGSEEGGAEYVVACACGVTYDDGAAMIECERCKAWAHIDCLKAQMASQPSKYSYDLDEYLCHSCGKSVAITDATAAAHGRQYAATARLQRCSSPTQMEQIMRGYSSNSIGMDGPSAGADGGSGRAQRNRRLPPRLCDGSMALPEHVRTDRQWSGSFEQSAFTQRAPSWRESDAFRPIAPGNTASELSRGGSMFTQRVRTSNGRDDPASRDNDSPRDRAESGDAIALPFLRGDSNTVAELAAAAAGGGGGLGGGGGVDPHMELSDILLGLSAAPSRPPSGMGLGSGLLAWPQRSSSGGLKGLLGAAGGGGVGAAAAGGNAGAGRPTLGRGRPSELALEVMLGSLEGWEAGAVASPMYGNNSSGMLEEGVFTNGALSAAAGGNLRASSPRISRRKPLPPGYCATSSLNYSGGSGGAASGSGLGSGLPLFQSGAPSRPTQSQGSSGRASPAVLPSSNHNSQQGGGGNYGGFASPPLLPPSASDWSNHIHGSSTRPGSASLLQAGMQRSLSAGGRQQRPPSPNIDLLLSASQHLPSSGAAAAGGQRHALAAPKAVRHPAMARHGSQAGLQRLLDAAHDSSLLDPPSLLQQQQHAMMLEASCPLPRCPSPAPPHDSNNANSNSHNGHNGSSNHSNLHGAMGPPSQQHSGPSRSFSQPSLHRLAGSVGRGDADPFPHPAFASPAQPDLKSPPHANQNSQPTMTQEREQPLPGAQSAGVAECKPELPDNSVTLGSGLLVSKGNSTRLSHAAQHLLSGSLTPHQLQQQQSGAHHGLPQLTQHHSSNTHSAAAPGEQTSPQTSANVPAAKAGHDSFFPATSSTMAHEAILAMFASSPTKAAAPHSMSSRLESHTFNSREVMPWDQLALPLREADRTAALRQAASSSRQAPPPVTEHLQPGQERIIEAGGGSRSTGGPAASKTLPTSIAVDQPQGMAAQHLSVEPVVHIPYHQQDSLMASLLAQQQQQQASPAGKGAGGGVALGQDGGRTSEQQSQHQSRHVSQAQNTSQHEGQRRDAEMMAMVASMQQQMLQGQQQEKDSMLQRQRRMHESSAPPPPTSFEEQKPEHPGSHSQTAEWALSQHVQAEPTTQQQPQSQSQSAFALPHGGDCAPSRLHAPQPRLQHPSVLQALSQLAEHGHHGHSAQHQLQLGNAQLDRCSNSTLSPLTDPGSASTDASALPAAAAGIHARHNEHDGSSMHAFLMQQQTQHMAHQQLQQLQQQQQQMQQLVSSSGRVNLPHSGSASWASSTSAQAGLDCGSNGTANGSSNGLQNGSLNNNLNILGLRPMTPDIPWGMMYRSSTPNPEMLLHGYGHNGLLGGGSAADLAALAWLKSGTPPLGEGLLSQSLLGMGMGNLCLPVPVGGPGGASSLLGPHTLGNLGLSLGLTMDCRPGSALGSGGLGSANSTRQAGTGGSGAGGDEFFNFEDFVTSTLASRHSAEPR